MTSSADRTPRQLLRGFAGIALVLSLAACGAPPRDPLAQRRTGLLGAARRP